MKQSVRITVSVGVGLLFAGLFPIYPHRSMTRSFTVGSGGDIISSSWDLRTVSRLFEGFRYDKPGPLELALDALAFAVLVTVVSLGAARALRRWRPS